MSRKEMNWTTERPDEAGLYWAYGKSRNKDVEDEPEIVRFDPAYAWVENIGSDYGADVDFYTHWGDRLIVPEKPQP